MSMTVLSLSLYTLQNILESVPIYMYKMYILYNLQMAINFHTL
jgi:hypothetical protein